MSEAAALFNVPATVPQVGLDPPVALHPATADDVKAALRRRHPGQTHGSMVGQWTCIEEWLGIDLLALNAWSRADVIGYEVKISRSDLRRELLKPHKRSIALECTTEFYFAVPEGLLTPWEIAYEEPEWGPEDFVREHCPGVPGFGPLVRGGGAPRYGGRCRRDRRRRKNMVRVPIADVIVAPDWMTPRQGESDESFLARVAAQHVYREDYVPCWRCGGRGHLEKSRVERDAPTCWVPRDAGLVTVSGRGCKVVKRSPKRKDPSSIAPTRKQLNDLVRWVSHRPDPRHR